MTTAISLNSGNTAWIIMATVLVLMMTIPGIALFYGGLVRRKNMLSVIMQSLSIVAVISIIWVVFGYSLAFGSGFDGNLFRYGIGGFDKVMLKGISLVTITTGGIPVQLFVTIQCIFAVIMADFILGAFAERVKFSGFLMFTILWSVFVYMPMAHWVWGGGFLMEMGAIDFAGGTVVHINAGVSALVMALLVGRRNDYRPGKPITPHNIPFVFIGTALLWLGWFGFNAGSGLAADGLAANAFLVTHIATCVAAVSWMTVDWIVNRKPTTVGACTGAVAGLVAITPAAGTADIPGAICIGLVASLVCFWMVAVVKPKFGYDDALDAFGVHGMGGMVGSVLTGVFATRAVTGDDGVQGALYGDWHQLWVQTATTLISVVFSAVMTFVIFRITDAVCGIRVMRRVEEEGLDVYEHGEAAYDM